MPTVAENYNAARLAGQGTGTANAGGGTYNTNAPANSTPYGEPAKAGTAGTGGSYAAAKPGNSMTTKIIIAIVIIAAAVGIYWYAFKRKKK